jgi:hypothetical protein
MKSKIFQDIANCLKTFDIAIWDISGHVNLAFRMTKSAFVEVCTMYHCEATLKPPNPFSFSFLFPFIYISCISSEMHNPII